jgi:hypothetical protein
MILVLGILSIVIPYIGLVLGIIAMVFGRIDLNKMKKNMMDRDGRGLTQAGWVCGIVGTILQSCCCLTCMLYFGAMAAIGIGAAKQAPPMQPPPVQRPPVKASSTGSAEPPTLTCTPRPATRVPHAV